jgi:NADPH:quinone reductase-like Zn-dependent oxidoreductase
MHPAAGMAVFADGRGDVRIERQDPPGEPSPEGLVVRMVHAPINPADLLAVEGRYAFQWPAREPLGAEGVGFVERVGSAVSDITPGDHVLPLSRGNWCGVRCLDRTEVVRIPAGIDRRQAAMMRINPMTARLLLDQSGAKAGDCIVQNGATSAVAHWTRLLARRRGIRVIGVGRNAGDGIIASTSATLADELADAAEGRPIRALLDCVAGAETGRLAAWLAPEGRVLVYGHLSGEPCQIGSQLLTGRGLTVSGFSLRPAEARIAPALRETLFAELFAVAAEERLDLPVKACFPLSAIDAALLSAREPGAGRVLLDLATISAM